MIRLLPILLLAGCATQAPIVQIRTVEVAVPVKCVAERPAPPELFTDSQMRDMNGYEAVHALYSNEQALRAYSDLLRAAMEGC
jgi:CheY-like chemotaxis protein